VKTLATLQLGHGTISESSR